MTEGCSLYPSVNAGYFTTHQFEYRKTEDITRGIIEGY